jgi:5-methylcytosine-specific restriction protein A
MFVEGELYSRRNDIHERFDGQRQGGISTPANHPFVFIFTGKSGEQHGYEDGWKDEGVFLYTGEGQEGDMRFIKGNAAIRDHAQNGKDLLLFEALGKGRPLRFLGRFACQSWDTFRGLDRNKQEREAIQFHLVKLASEVELDGDQDFEPPEFDDLAELRKKAFEAARPRQSPKWSDAPRAYRERSKAVRDYVLARAGGKCELTGKDAPFLTSSGAPYLEVHHTRRLADGGPDDPRFVAAICPTVHREIHYGENGKDLNDRLKVKLEQIERT